MLNPTMGQAVVDVKIEDGHIFEGHLFWLVQILMSSSSLSGDAYMA